MTHQTGLPGRYVFWFFEQSFQITRQSWNDAGFDAPCH
jgi:hypothetical protein